MDTELSTLSRSVMTDFPIRKSREQKERFRGWLCDRLREQGYSPKVETGGRLVKSNNVVVGDPDSCELLLTAHYDTCAVLPVPNFITPMNLPVLLLYQLLAAVVLLGMGVLAELLLLFLWPEAPMWLACMVVYGVLLFCLWWMLAGKANKSCVNDNTSGVMTLLEIALAMPPEQRDRVCFVFFDNEEKGLLGSAAFAKAHKKVRMNTLNLNFDCVSDGDYIWFFPNKQVKREADVLDELSESFTAQYGKQVGVNRRFGYYPSDQKQLSRGVGVCALNKAKVAGYYMGRIHTGRDTVMQEENLLLLRDGVLNYLARTEACAD